MRMRSNIWVLPRVLLLVGVLVSVMGFGARAQVPNAVFFVNGPEKSPYNITLTVASIEARKAGGAWVPVTTAPFTINSIEMVDNQLMLGEFNLPSGNYDKLRFKYSKARWIQEGKTFDLNFPEEGMEFDYSFAISDDDIIPVFIVWDVRRCIEEHVHLAPCFSFKGKALHLPEVVTYVTSENTNSVYVLDRHKDRVVSLIRVGEKPRGMAVNPDDDRAYVVNSGEDTLSVIDTRYGKVIYKMNLELGSEATTISISSDNQKLYVCNSGTNSVSVIDVDNFEMIETVHVGVKPVFTVSNPRSDKVFVVNENSHEISVIDTSSDDVVKTISVELYPERAEIDQEAGKLYVVSPRSGFISVIALSSDTVVRKLRLYGRPLTVAPASRGERIYITDADMRQIQLYDLVLENEILVGDTGEFPFRVVTDSRRGKLYIVNRDSGTVSVLNALTLKHLKTIQVGKSPWFIVFAR